MTAQKGLFIGCLCFFQRIPTDGFVLADKSTIRFPEPLRKTEAKRLLSTHISRNAYVSEPSLRQQTTVQYCLESQKLAAFFHSFLLVGTPALGSGCTPR